MILKQKYIRQSDGHVAVLISSKCSAGWSTWNEPDLAEWAMMDKGLVEMALAGSKRQDVDAYIDRETDGRRFFTLGWDNITVEFLPVGTKFRIVEYDGEESLVSPEVDVFTA